MNYRIQSVAGRTSLVVMAIVMAVVIAIGLTMPATGWTAETEQPQTSWAEVGAVPPTHKGHVGEEFSGGFKLQYQIGMWYRLAGHRIAAKQDPWLLTLDLVGLVWDREHATWGLGGHLAYDSDGMRVGLKGLWRIPLGLSSNALGLSSASYLQISPGIYLSADRGNERYDYMTAGQRQYGGHRSYGRLDLPAFFCEVELGFADQLSLLTAFEILPITWSTQSSYGEPGSAVNQTKTLDWNWYAGAKLGQVPGVVATVMLAAVGVLVLASWGGICCSGY